MRKSIIKCLLALSLVWTPIVVGCLDTSVADFYYEGKVPRVVADFFDGD
jgi:hypothetical protein